MTEHEDAPEGLTTIMTNLQKISENEGGSDFAVEQIKAIQKVLGLKQDGVVGPNTVKKFTNISDEKLGEIQEITSTIQEKLTQYVIEKARAETIEMEQKNQPTTPRRKGVIQIFFAFARKVVCRTFVVNGWKTGTEYNSNFFMDSFYPTTSLRSVMGNL